MENQEQIFREKAEKYMVCFNAECPLHEQCLRWTVGHYVDSACHVVTCVNPRYAPAAKGRCDLFRDNRPITMPIGMTGFYRDMPGHTEHSIKRRLIAQSCRSTYYKYHRGDRPITPDMQELITRISREEGWQGALTFDGEVTDYVW